MSFFRTYEKRHRGKEKKRTVCSEILEISTGREGGGKDVEVAGFYLEREGKGGGKKKEGAASNLPSSPLNI